MNITDQRLREFQKAYLIDFNESISMDEARDMLARLVTLYELIGQPLQKVSGGDT